MVFEVIFESVQTYLYRWLNDFNALSITTKALAVSTAVVIVVACTRKRRYNLPPGPTPLPLLGNLWAFRSAYVVDKFNEWKEKYGSIFTFYAGPVRMFVIGDVETLNQALVEKGTDFSGRPFFYSLDKVTEGSKDIAFSDYGETWKYQRKLAAQALRQYLLGDQLEIRVHETLKPIIDAMKAQKTAFDPHRYLSLTVYNIIHGICFGETFTLDDPMFVKFLNMFDTFTEMAENGFLEDVFPPLRWWPTKRFQQLIKVADEFNEHVHAKVDEHKLKLNPDEVRDLADNVLLAHQQALREEPAKAVLITDTHIAQTIADVFGAGVDTSRMTLDWVFLLMAAYPDLQKRVQEEVDDVVGNGFPRRAHRSKLLLTEAFLLETMRLYNVAPMAVPHKTLRDTSIAGYEIPAQSIVVPFLHGILRDPKNCEDPLQFRPERFLSTDGTKLEMKEKGWVPFSVGHRSCIGESLAKLELVYIIAGLIQKLEFSMPPGVTPNLKPYKPGQTFTVHRYEVLVTPRNK